METNPVVDYYFPAQMKKNEVFGVYPIFRHTLYVFWENNNNQRRASYPRGNAGFLRPPC